MALLQEFLSLGPATDIVASISASGLRVEDGSYDVIPLKDLEEWCDENEWNYASVIQAFDGLDVSERAAVMGFDGNIRFFYPAETETEAPPSPSDPGFLEWAEEQSSERLEQFGRRGA